VSLDERLLESHASYSDADTGITERFVSLQMRSGHTLGVLSTPSGEQQPLGWVLCHSFAREQVDLAVTDAVIARRVAAAGFPVLRFHSQGYGDSEFPEYPASVSSHVADAVDAVEALRALAGVERVGGMGTKFGGAVAALAAERLGLKDLVLVAPVVNGNRFMNELIRSLALTQIASSAQGSVTNTPTGEFLRQLLEEQGYLDWKGLKLTLDVVNENGAMDLLKDVPTFDGRALLVQVSTSEKPQAGLERLAARLAKQGAAVGRATVLHRQAALFGQKHVLITGPASNDDLFAQLHVEIAEAVADWLAAPADGPAFATVRDAGESLSRGRTHADPDAMGGE
jgi:pimeloyl-ACP methyl ester carboxylesterase